MDNINTKQNQRVQQSSSYNQLNNSNQDTVTAKENGNKKGNLEHQQRRLYNIRNDLGEIERGRKGQNKEPLTAKAVFSPSVQSPWYYGSPSPAAANGKEYLEVTYGVANVKGTEGNDTITWNRDELTGEYYVDVNGKRLYVKNEDLPQLQKVSVEAGGGNDIIDFSKNDNAAIALSAKGGMGDDKLIGGAGNDELWGKEGNDEIIGGEGNDILHGGRGDDHLDGGAGNDVIHAGKYGLDTLAGGEGDDILYGRIDVDSLDGGGQNDQLIWRGQSKKSKNSKLDTALNDEALTSSEMLKDKKS